MIRKRKAFTLAETMVGVAIAALLGLAIMKLMTNTQLQAAKARCKSQLRQSLQIASKYLQRDIESSRVIYDKAEKKYKATIKQGTPLLTIEVPKKQNDETTQNYDNVSFFDSTGDNEYAVEDELYVTVTYNLSENGDLTRTVDGKTHKVATNIKKIDFGDNGGGEDVETTYSGKIDLIVTLEGKPDGSNEKVSIEEQHVVIAIRQLQNRINIGNEEAKVDNHWKQRIGKEDY